MWSDYPVVSFKRWIKAIGTVIMALVILTERRPWEAFGDVVRRLSILVVPISIVLCKMFPEFGRGHHHDNWTYIGMAAGKNLLGQLCLIAAVYFSWNLAFRRRLVELSWPPMFITLTLLMMTAWLLSVANSATALSCVVVAVCILVGSRMPSMERNPRRIVNVGVIVAIALWLIDAAFNIREFGLATVNRGSDLTSRLPMWRDLVDRAVDPFFGSGYESFWLGNRMQDLLIKYGGVQQAHNGYLETYLNLGMIGLVIMLVSMLSGLAHARRELGVNYSWGVMRLAILAIVALYNWTEAAFYGINNMWLLFFVAAISVSTPNKLWETSRRAEISEESGRLPPRLRSGVGLRGRSRGEGYGRIPARAGESPAIGNGGTRQIAEARRKHAFETLVASRGAAPGMLLPAAPLSARFPKQGTALVRTRDGPAE
jgi:hypothetical protein